MQFGDFEKGIDSLIKLAICPLLLLIVFSVITQAVSQLSFIKLFGLLAVLVLTSPIAYFILQSERPRSEHRPRRGAERTPILPPTEEH